MSVPTLDSLAELLAEIAAPDVPVAEIVVISNRLTAVGVSASHVRSLIAAGATDDPRLRRDEDGDRPAEAGLYTFVCDPRFTSMKGSFRVT